MRRTPIDRPRGAAVASWEKERGSALLIALFVMVLLLSLGIALLTLGEVEVRMSQADSRNKAVFFIAETGVEDGRERLRIVNPISPQPLELEDELAFFAGVNGRIDFDVNTLAPVYGADGRVTGFTGYGDDRPVASPTAFSGGMYAAFVTNDPGEGETNLTDLDNRLLVTAMGTGAGRAVEVVQAIVEMPLLPVPPSPITILGEEPEFEGGKSAAKRLTGNDCVSLGIGIPGLYVPIVGVIGSDAEDEAEDGVDKPLTYRSGPDTGVDTVSDVEGIINPLLTDCHYMHDLALTVRDFADVVGDSSTPPGELGVPGDPKVVYIEGDYAIGNNLVGAGLLWVTGELFSNGNVRWEGIIFVVGEGHYRRTGAGNQNYLGGFIVADVAGPDDVLWTDDDCAGPDGLAGNADDDFEPEAAWDVNGAGTGRTEFCTTKIYEALQFPFRVSSFRQR